jgi:hypothetical protein
MSNPPAISPILEKLRRQVDAAAGEFDLATMFYEAWRTAADDDALHTRLGKSYATNTFRVIMTALRRELLLALTRMWDKPQRALRMSAIAHTIRDPQTVGRLAAARGEKIHKDMVRPGGAVPRASVSAITGSIRHSLVEKAAQVLEITDKYEHGGAGFEALEKLKTVRNERLAHYHLEAVVAPDKDATDEEIEEFYRDNLELVRLLLSLVTATAYDPQEGADVHHTYAMLFWASVRGERTEGHPNYQRPR